MTGRVVLGLLGVLVAAYGAWLLLTRQSGDQLVSAGQWLVGGVVLHDAVLAPVVVALGLVLSRVLPAAWRAPTVVVTVVLGSITLLAVPVLGGFGRRADNPTLLDRDYGAGWWVLAAAVVITVALATVVTRVRERRSNGERAGR